jgi:hypothetical protein
MPLAARAFHCMPVRNTRRMAFIALLSGTRGRWQPSGCGGGGRGGRRGSIFAHSQSGMRQPSSRSMSPMVAPLIGVRRPADQDFVMRCRSPFGIGPKRNTPGMRR